MTVHVEIFELVIREEWEGVRLRSHEMRIQAIPGSANCCSL